jgi:hypothetical protein
MKLTKFSLLKAGIGFSARRILSGLKLLCFWSAEVPLPELNFILSFSKFLDDEVKGFEEVAW